MNAVLILKEKKDSYRILRSTKNRFGSSNEIAVFNMEEEGMRKLKIPLNIF